MTPETREELARAFERCLERHGVGIGAVEGTLDDADAIAPLIERLVAERVAGESATRRDSIKEAFGAGFAAARSGNVADAWEEAAIRKALDYPAIRSATRGR